MSEKEPEQYEGCPECGCTFICCWWYGYVEDDEAEEGFGLLAEFVCNECDHEWSEFYLNYSEYG